MRKNSVFTVTFLTLLYLSVIPTTAAPRTPPTGFEVTSINSYQVSLRWVDNADDEETYYIERTLTNADSWEAVGSVAENVTFFTDISVACFTEYSYRIRLQHKNVNLADVYSEIRKAWTLSCASPTELSSTLRGNTIDLVWTDDSDDETGFEIERYLRQKDEWKVISSTNDNLAELDVTQGCGQTHSYRVRSYWNLDPYELPKRHSGYTNIVEVVISCTSVEKIRTQDKIHFRPGEFIGFIYAIFNRKDTVNNLQYTLDVKSPTGNSIEGFPRIETQVFKPNDGLIMTLPSVLLPDNLIEGIYRFHIISSQFKANRKFYLSNGGPKKLQKCETTSHCLRWQAASYAKKGYQIQIATDKDFVFPVSDFITKKRRYIYEDLQAGIYYWRVRGIFADNKPGHWSKTKRLIFDSRTAD